MNTFTIIKGTILFVTIYVINSWACVMYLRRMCTIRCRVQYISVRFTLIYWLGLLSSYSLYVYVCLSVCLCALDLSCTEGEIVKFQILSVFLSVSPYLSYNLCFIKAVILFRVKNFIIVISLLSILTFSITEDHYLL